MRVTSQLFPEAFKSQLQDVLARQYNSQNQVSTGLKFTKASEDPVAFERAQQAKSSQLRDQGYLNANDTATTSAQNTYQGMSEMMTLVNRASEIVTRASGALNPQDIQIQGSELSGIIDQMVDIANRQVDGNYLYGGVGNVAPITVTPGSPPTYAYSASASYTSTVQQVQVNVGYTVDVGMTAGQTGGGGFNGFFYDGTTDVLSTLTTIRDALIAGNAPTQPQQKATVNSVNVIANNVGLAAAKLQALSINETRLNSQIRDGKTQMSNITSVVMADALNDLQQATTNYQAALQSGASILNLSLLNYLR